MKINSVFQWHDKPQQINKLCCEQCRYKLLTPSVRLLPFQFTFALATSSVIGFTVRNVDTNIVYALPLAVLKTRLFSGVKYLYYEGDYLGLTLPCGYYVGEITDDTSQIYTSSEFYVMGAVFGENLAPLIGAMTFGPNWSDTVNGWCKPSGVFDTITIPAGLVAGKTYKVVLEYTRHIGQAVTIDIGGGSSTTHPATNMSGIFEFTGVAGASTDVVIGSTTLNNVCFANIKVYEVFDNIGQCNYHLRFNNCSQVGNVIYSDTLFYQEFFIDAESEIYNRTPKRITEVSKNIDGSETPIFERLEYTQDLYLGRMPKEIADALVTIPLHDYAELVAKRFYSIDKILSPIITASSSEETNFCFTDVSLNFQYDDAIVKTNCCDNELIAVDEKKCVGVARLKLEGDPNINSFFMVFVGSYYNAFGTYFSGIGSAFNPNFQAQIINELQTMPTTLTSNVDDFTFEFIDNEIILRVLVNQSQIATTAPKQIYLNAQISTSNIVHVPFIYECCKQYRRYLNTHTDFFNEYNLDASDQFASGVCTVPYRNIFTIEKFTIDGVSHVPATNVVNIDFDVAKNPTNAIKTNFVSPLPHSEYDTVMTLINSVSPLIQFKEGMFYADVLDANIKFHVRFKLEIYYCNSGVFTLGTHTSWASVGGGTIDFFHNGSTYNGNGIDIEQYGYETFIENCTL